jgi:hypothetical protein
MRPWVGEARFDATLTRTIRPEATTMARKPVAAAVVGSLLLVVCDDGSVFELDPNGAWIERVPVPGTAAAHADEIRRQEPRFD